MIDASQLKLPQDIAAEQGLLSSLMIAPKEVGALCSERRITEEFFANPGHQLIYAALMRHWDKGEALDFIGLTAYLKKRKELDMVGGTIGKNDSSQGAAYVTALYSMLGSASAVRNYIDLVEECHWLRICSLSSIDMANRALAHNEDLEKLQEAAQRHMMSLTDMAAGRKTHAGMQEVVLRVLQKTQEIWENNQNNGRKLRGLSTGLYDLDDFTGGLCAPDVTVISGRTSDGKSSLGLTIAKHVAMKLGQGVGIISLEMTEEELTECLISMESGVSLFALRNGRMTTDDLMKVNAAANLVFNAPIYIDDEHSITVNNAAAKLRRLKVKKDIKLAVIDYIQLLNGNDRRRGNRSDEVAEVSRTLKQLAKELNIAIVELSQLNDDGALRESRAIGHDANNVYSIRHDGNDSVIEIGKQRGGSRGEVPVYFHRECVRFMDLHCAPPPPAKPVKSKPAPKSEKSLI
jgi:replicative DNA helicase